MTNPSAQATSKESPPQGKPQWDGHERRNHPRYSVKDTQSEFAQVEFTSFFKKDGEGGRPLVDVGEGGVQFACDRPFGKGQKVIVCIIVPSMSLSLKANGAVTGFTAGGAGKKSRASVQFRRCSAESALKLRALAVPLSENPALAELYVKRELPKDAAKAAK
ncbi:MAG: hypothetical protein FJ272_14370 [Planctomycetes bacterium]|nr:hypothetical protein [Planctomycetota bacterium]MBM4085967.1 hypothetical protein [Planctomycetota bacterium]